jgi:hypothetical protein
MGLTLEMLVPENSFSRKLEKQMDFDWLIGQVKPYFPDAQDRTAAPVRVLCLIMLEHLEPYGLRCADKPLLVSIYENWRDNTAYMWLLQAVPGDIPAYKALSNFGDIPAFEDVFYPAADKLPPDVLRELLAHVLTNCAASHIAVEYPDQPLYYMNRLSKEEQAAEVERLACGYAEQFYQEVAAYRDLAGQ